VGQIRVRQARYKDRCECVLCLLSLCDRYEIDRYMRGTSPDSSCSDSRENVLSPCPFPWSPCSSVTFWKRGSTGRWWGRERREQGGGRSWTKKKGPASYELPTKLKVGTYTWK
jgi:hypothetical protein